MQLFVKIPEGTKTITLNVVASNTIKHIKNLIKKSDGIKRKDQRIVYNGPDYDFDLENDHTLFDYRIANETTVQLVRT